MTHCKFICTRHDHCFHMFPAVWSVWLSQHLKDMKFSECDSQKVQCNITVTWTMQGTGSVAVEVSVWKVSLVTVVRKKKKCYADEHAYCMDDLAIENMMQVKQDMVTQTGWIQRNYDTDTFARWAQCPVSIPCIVYMAVPVTEHELNSRKGIFIYVLLMIIWVFWRKGQGWPNNGIWYAEHDCSYCLQLFVVEQKYMWSRLFLW